MAGSQTLCPSRALDVTGLLNPNTTAHSFGATSRQSPNAEFSGSPSELLLTSQSPEHRAPSSDRAPVVQPHQPASPYDLPPAAPISSSASQFQGSQSAQSQTTSPSTSYLSLSQPSHTSPVSYFRPLAAQELQQSYPTPSQFNSLGIQQGEGRSTGSPPDSGFSNAPGDWQQKKYLLYFGSGEQGPIPVPVDIHAASKQTDEKRKRNAGASARFRARRKEKEREASHTIAKLEEQIRDLTEERDFYHTERDYFRSLFCGGPQLPPRPVSPRLLRPAEQVQHAAAQATSGSPWAEDQGEGVMRKHTYRQTNTVPIDLASRPRGMRAAYSRRLDSIPTGALCNSFNLGACT